KEVQNGWLKSNGSSSTAKQMALSQRNSIASHTRITMDKRELYETIKTLEISSLGMKCTWVIMSDDGIFLTFRGSSELDCVTKLELLILWQSLGISSQNEASTDSNLMEKISEFLSRRFKTGITRHKMTTNTDVNKT